MFLICLFVGFTSMLNEGKAEMLPKNNTPSFLYVESGWADSVLATLSLDEKIAQLFMVAAYSNKDVNHVKYIENLVSNYKIGGLIFMQGGPSRQVKLANRYQKTSKVPLMFSIDGEWGLSMRLDSTVRYPWQMTLGAIQKDSLLFEMGKHIGEQCKRVGLHVNFAPVIDVNVNPKNPIINARSFGEQRENVANKGIAYMKGMQSVKILANAKHFPGHGDTEKDSHKTLPIITHNTLRMDSIELYPFKKLFEQGLASVMVAHLYIPAYIKGEITATTLSKNVVTHLLQDSLRFKGLIFTDALNMKGVSSYYKPGEVDVKALLAGNDVLLFSENVPLAIEAIKKAITQGKITEQEIDRRCLKILKAKEWAGLNHYKPVNQKNLQIDLNNKKYVNLRNELFKNSLTVLKNEDNLIPFKKLEHKKIAVVTIGKNASTFIQTLNNYKEATVFSYDKLDEKNIEGLMDSINAYNTVVVSIHKSNKSPWKSYKIAPNTKHFISELNKKSVNVVLAIFANPYSLIDFDAASNVSTLIMSYQNSIPSQSYTAQLIYGGIGATGKIPVSISDVYKAGTGLHIKPLGRLTYGLPSEVGMNNIELNKIDSIALKGIREKAYPGCQVLVARKNKVIYNKSFGYHTYDKVQPVKNQDIYDLASITKISASLLALMQLQDENKFDLDTNLFAYLHQLIPDSSLYGNLIIREILAHQAGLQAWVPFYLKTLINGNPRYEIYSLDSSALYSKRVANNLYINKYYKDTIFKRILRGPLKEKEYRYSDLGYYFMQKIIETQTGEPLNIYVESTYKSIGASTLGYLPRNKFKLSRIVPTEYDKVFRKQLIHGDVHDPGAAMMGGVGGHAGVFSSANDLAKLMQMYLNKGKYGGIRYIQDTTISEYIKCQFCKDDNRRGAGFDKPVRDGEGGPTCDCVSYLSFGHSGFTGTIAWVDPEKEIVYIFLSNRIYKDAENKKLLKLNIRTDIQEVIYNSIED